MYNWQTVSTRWDREPLTQLKWGSETSLPCPNTNWCHDQEQTDELKPQSGVKSEGREKTPCFTASCKQGAVPKTMLLHKADFPSPGFPVQEETVSYFAALLLSPSPSSDPSMGLKAVGVLSPEQLTGAPGSMAVPGLSACSSCRSGPQAKGRTAHLLSCSSHPQGHRSKVTHTNDYFQYPPFRSEALYEIKPNLIRHLPAQKSTRCRDGRSQIPTDSSTGKLCGQAPLITATLPAAGSPKLLSFAKSVQKRTEMREVARKLK